MGREADSKQSPVAPHPHLHAYYSEVDDRQRFVNRLFDRGARHYTWINHVMSFGTGVWYRREALLRAGFKESDLDGTWQPFMTAHYRKQR